jgi:ATP-dependent DNA helicase PIF1
MFKRTTTNYGLEFSFGAPPPKRASSAAAAGSSGTAGTAAGSSAASVYAPSAASSAAAALFAGASASAPFAATSFAAPAKPRSKGAASSCLGGGSSAAAVAAKKPPRKRPAVADGAAADAPPAAKRNTTGPLFDMESALVGQLSDTQRPALDLILQGKNVFLTGAAGSGKSKLVHVLAQLLTEADTPFAITASTGIAAEPFQAYGSTTIDAFTGITPKGTPEAMLANAIKTASSAKGRKRISAPRILIIDEVSMISKEKAEMIVAVLKTVHKSLPIIVFTGDFCQLDPVSGSTLLNSDIWKSLAIVPFLLVDNWRQKGDEDFKAVLDAARFGSLSNKDILILEQRLGMRLQSNGVTPTYLTARRAKAEEKNAEELAKLGTPEHVFVGEIYQGTVEAGGGVRRAPDGVPFGTAPCPLFLAPQYMAAHSADFQRMATDMLRQSNTEPRLVLKVGAQVLFTCNVSPPTLVNGSRGVVTAIADGAVTVRLMSGVEVAVVPFLSQQPLPYDKGLVMVYAQLPLMLAWGITIHKAQGMSLDFADVDIGGDIFADGQAYVALSRARSLGGLSLTAFRRQSIKAKPEVVAFYRSLMKSGEASPSL